MSDCLTCNGDRVIDEDCRCRSMHVAYNCVTCANCGIVEVECPDCDEDDDPSDDGGLDIDDPREDR